ncbi:glycosyltransferase family 2 protein [Papillibacter cinnamivorans]|uniref:Dolichol-phosphate mannosyltransferase n=1 Tax=Papillibacter cinnamivorans DSM 12816 TaxID=1122930 RepID=A0A1W2BF60_9FIRM|nr:glycosyltransferase family 2 protein [Papillibacter cinnamivorans]SMC71569.1 dolichol-phosphate mannosyltransferase [Papillibacter cinnamivorans DSM 12816]
MSALFSVVIPAYNEEEVIEESHKRLSAVMEQSGGDYELIFVNDGSADKTPELLREICSRDKHSKMVSFSRNFGHQTAITAGMEYATGEAVIVIDADLQDPPEVILQMIAKWKEGFDVVYGKRLKRKGETAFKKVTARLFYRTLNLLTDVKIPADVGDFRLIDRKVCNALKSLPERNRYVRGLVSWVGFKQTAVEYVREERFAGETKYPLRKMVKFASDGITSFSHKPLKISIYVGGFLSLFSFIYMIVVICQRLFGHSAISGWASSMAVSLFFNGVTLIMLGIIGEYIGRIYDEAKGRPLYIVGETAGFNDDKH